MAHITVNQPPQNSYNKPIPTDKHVNVSTHLSESAAQMEEAANLRQPEKNKLDMIDIIEGIRQGNMPTNEKFSYFLEELANIRAIQERQHLMSPDGQRLLQDFKALLKTLQKALYVKNREQKFQSLYHHLYNADYQSATEQAKPNLTGATGTNREEAKNDLKEGASAIMNILKLVVTNPRFRRQLNELISIAQEVFSDASNKMNEALQNDSQKMNQTAQHLNDRFQEYAEEGKNQLSNDQVDTDPTEAKKNIVGRVRDAQQRQPELQERAKQEVHDRADQAKQYARDKFPPERVDAIVHRLKLVFNDIQQHPKYKDAINTLLSLIHTWSERLGNVGESGSSHAKTAASDLRSEPNLSAAQDELKAILEEWAQGRSIDSFLGSVQKVVADVKNDSDLRQCYDETTQYLRHLAKEPGYASADQSTEDGKRLVRRARELTEGRYRGHIDFLFQEAKSFIHAMNDDPMARELDQSLTQIHKDLWYDRDGNTAFKPHLFTDMRITLIPAFLEFIKVIPIPKVDYSDPQFDISVENIILPGDTLLPRLVETKMENYIRFSPYTNITNINQQGIWIKLSQITTEIKDVIWYYKKKTGFPKLTDRGVASVIIGGRGLSVTARIISDSKDSVHTFRVTQCKANIAGLSVKVNKSGHNILYKTVNPLMTTIVKRQIARAIEAKVKDVIENADTRFTTMMMQHYKEAMSKNETWNDLATTSQTQQQPQQQVAVDSQGRPIGPKDHFERPGLMAAFFTILNRNMKSNVVRGIQDQKDKHRERKAEKMANRESRQQQGTDPYASRDSPSSSPTTRSRDGNDFGSDQLYSARQNPQQYQSMAGAATGTSTEGDGNTVPVIVKPDGSTYIKDERTGQLRPVNLSQEAYDHTRGLSQQQQPQQGQRNPGPGFFGMKRTSQDADGNQGHVHNPTGPAPNVM